MNYAKTCYLENFTQLKKLLVVNVDDSVLVTDDREQWYITPQEYYGRRRSDERSSLKLIRWITGPWTGYKIISRLSIKQAIQQQADQWGNENIRGKCVGVHYRQTDVLHQNRIISVDSYIDYLRQVIDGHYQIYACSDNVQFIEAIHKEFSGRVVSRDITRSKDGRSLHRHKPYVGHQQKQDALIDMLILAKLEIIYTLGSYFIDTIKFFNPEIKIIALNKLGSIGHKSKIMPNYLPVPRMDLVRKAKADIAWKELLPSDKAVDVRYEKK